MAKILITGGSGMLGRVLLNAFPGHQVIGTALTRARGELHRLDLSDFTATRSFVTKEMPATIIHAAAERRPDVSEKNPEGTKKLNVDATAELARIAHSIGAWIVYLSTDYVFDGTHPPYSPGDATNPLNYYGKMKLLGEQVLRQELLDAAIVRVGVLFVRVEFPGESAV